MVMKFVQNGTEYTWSNFTVDADPNVLAIQVDLIQVTQAQPDDEDWEDYLVWWLDQGRDVYVNVNGVEF